MRSVLRINMAFMLTYVGTVHRETGNNLLQCEPQTLQREVPGMTVPLAYPVQPAGQNVELTGHRNTENQPLAFVDQIGKGSVVSGELLIRLRKQRLGPGIHEKRVE